MGPLFLALALAAGEPTLDASQPVLIASGDGYLVHGVPFPSGSELEALTKRLGGGVLITYLDTRTSAMRVLFRSGTVAIPTVRISFHQTRIAGLVHDATRLYVLEWGTSGYDRPPSAGTTGRYKLRVFALPGGRETHSLHVVDVPDTAEPSETLESGPLRLIPGGIEVFGRKQAFPGTD